MLRYAVIGFPVSHSKSPFIHRQFALQTGIELDYTATEVLPDKLSEFVARFFAGGGSGLNVTLPHKEAAFGLARHHSSRSTLARAANTLYQNADGDLCADNTDGVGLLADLQKNHEFSVAGKKALILGAGGAVRGILGALCTQKPESVTIANRTLEKADQLQREFSNTFPLRAVTYYQLSREAYDLIINGTSMGLVGEMPPIQASVVAPGCCCYDMAYGQEPTVFVKWAQDHGAALVLDGLGMLVEQAAESFSIWHGLRPDTAPVIANLQQHLGREIKG